MGGTESTRGALCFGCADCEIREGQESSVTAVSGFFPRSDPRWVWISQITICIQLFLPTPTGKLGCCRWSLERGHRARFRPDVVVRGTRCWFLVRLVVCKCREKVRGWFGFVLRPLPEQTFPCKDF